MEDINIGKDTVIGTVITKGVIEDDINLGKLTQEEEAILRLTEEIWNRFLELPINHPMEMDEMAIKIHDIQRMIISRPGFRLNQEMFNQYGKGNSDKGDDHKRILRCSEGNRVWYRLWINPEDMMRIEPLLEGGDRIWMEELDMYYTFFYEIRNGRRVLGKDRVKKILDTIL